MRRLRRQNQQGCEVEEEGTQSEVGRRLQSLFSLESIHWRLIMTDYAETEWQIAMCFASYRIRPGLRRTTGGMQRPTTPLDQHCMIEIRPVYVLFACSESPL